MTPKVEHGIGSRLYRVSAEHKLRLVRAMQADGAVIAMTGDSVNDAPGTAAGRHRCAMGLAGTAAAKEASDIVLADDNFAPIRAAIEEGRRVYDNLVKALAFALPTNVGGRCCVRREGDGVQPDRGLAQTARARLAKASATRRRIGTSTASS